MSHDTARQQLAQMRARLKLDPTNKWLKVEILLSARSLRSIGAADAAGTLEPLPALLAELAQGHITADTAGAAITRDLSLASQVAAVAINGQAGDVTIGDVASGSIYHIYIGGPHDDRK